MQTTKFKEFNLKNVFKNEMLKKSTEKCFFFLFNRIYGIRDTVGLSDLLEYKNIKVWISIKKLPHQYFGHKSKKIILYYFTIFRSKTSFWSSFYIHMQKCEILENVLLLNDHAKYLLHLTNFISCFYTKPKIELLVI